MASLALSAQSATGGGPIVTTSFLVQPKSNAFSGDGFDRDGDHDRDNDALLESFVTLQASRSGEVFRGVAFAPQP